MSLELEQINASDIIPGTLVANYKWKIPIRSDRDKLSKVTDFLRHINDASRYYVLTNGDNQYILNVEGILEKITLACRKRIGDIHDLNNEEQNFLNESITKLYDSFIE